MNQAFFTRLPRIGRGLAALMLVGAATAAPRLASAATFTFAVPTISVDQEPYDQTGYFDVTVTASGATTLAQFQADLLLYGGASGVNFMNADLSTTAPYALTGNSQEISSSGSPYAAGYLGLPGNGPPYAPLATSEASNSDGTNSLTVSLNGSTAYGLMRVEYDVPANTAVGSYTMSFNQDSPNTDPYADYLNTISPTSPILFSPQNVTNGAIDVISAVVSPPTLTVTGGSSGGTGPFNDNQPGQFSVTVDSGVTVTSNNANIDGATVDITSGFHVNGDFLSVGAPVLSYLAGGAAPVTSGTTDGISWSYSSLTGLLTLTGSASPATYQTVLDEVSFQTISGHGTRDISFSASDSTASPTTNGPVSGDFVVVTPEPGSVVMMVFGAVGLIGIGYRRMRGRRA